MNNQGLEFTKGDTYQSGDDNHFASGIDHLTTDANSMSPLGVCSNPRKPAKTWFERIVCYGQDAEQADALRDRLLSALAVCDGKGHYVDPNKLEPITPSCLEYAQRARAAWACRENRGFALEAAYQYGASEIDDEGDLVVMTTENLINLMAALGFDHRKDGSRCIVCPPDESFKCQTCKDSGVVSTTDKDHNGDHIEQRCPVCAGGVDERAAFEAWYETTYGISLEPELRANHFIGYVNDKANHRWTAWQARATLSAPSHGERVPTGWKLVPVDPTNAMTHIGQSLRYDSVNSIGHIYRQMLAAAPSAGSQEQGE